MTMKRNAKASQQRIIAPAASAEDMVQCDFASPTEIAKRGGRRQMTRAEYITFRIHGHRGADMARELKDMHCRYRRRPVRVA
jgi:hypothetical protein